MATIDSAVSIEELIRQCDMALEAIGNLNFALMNLYQVPYGGGLYDSFREEIFAIIYTFLVSADCISRMLWSAKEDGKLSRGRLPDVSGYLANGSFSQKALRRTLETPRKRFLKIFKRKYLFPSALGNGAAETFRESEACHIIGSPIAFTRYPSRRGLRIYDPTTRYFHLDGEIYPLQEIAAAVARLRSCACREAGTPARILSGGSGHRFDVSRKIGRERALL